LLNASLWVAQGLLAIVFSLSGLIKLTRPLYELGQSMPWVLSVPTWLVRSIGVVELLGAIGIILPAITRVRPQLVSMAGTGLATVMVLAAGVHISRGELTMLPVTLVLGSMALFVGWGRARRMPLAARDTEKRYFVGRDWET
jgi:uncharacterized membrane protein